MEFSGQTVLVTGAASGIGRAMAESFAAQGARICALDLNAQALEQTTAELRRQGADVLPLVADVSDPQSMTSAVESAYRQIERIDVLINNAGIAQHATPIEEVEVAFFDRIFGINVRSVFLACRAVVPHMKEQKHGVILSVASIVAKRPRPGLNLYAASKGAVVTLTKSLALELAPFQIRVNAISPVATDTPMLPQFQKVGSEAPKALFVETIPLGRLAQPTDMAEAALFLASEKARMITGVDFEVDGGRGI